MQDLFKNYLRNECTPDEVQQVLQLLLTPEGRATMESLLISNESLLNRPAAPTPESTERMWARLANDTIDTNFQSNHENQPITERVVPLWTRRLGWVAAAMVPALLVGYLLVRQKKTTAEEEPQKTAYADFGQTRRVELPDGSVVMLNGNSSVRYSNNWSADNDREVWLKGEAFFCVTHQKNNQKFMVHTARHHTIEVLGTEFNVNERSGKTSVVLKSGKIKLVVQQKQSQQSLLMKPGQRAEIDTVQQQVQLKTVKTDVYTSWQNRQLVFEGTRLAEIASMMKETYDLTLTVPDQRLMEEKITGTIPSGNVNELLTALAVSLKLKYSKENNLIKFYQSTTNQ